MTRSRSASTASNGSGAEGGDGGQHGPDLAGLDRRADRAAPRRPRGSRRSSRPARARGGGTRRASWPRRGERTGGACMAGDSRVRPCRRCRRARSGPLPRPLRASPRGFRQAYVREGVGGVPLVCVHGWPETKRIYWKVIEPLAAAGFEVIVPDLRGFGDSDLGPDGLHDVASPRPRPATRSSTTQLGHERVVLHGRRPRRPRRSRTSRSATRTGSTAWCCSTRRCRSTRSAWPGMRTRPPREASDYFVRQATDADALAAELATPGRAAPVHRHLLHVAVLGPPGRVRRPAAAAAGPVRGSAVVDFHTEPFADARQAAGQLRRLREHGRARRPGSSRRASARNDAHADARAVRRPLTTCSTPTSTGWRRWCSTVTSGHSCSGTAATSCPGRRPTPLVTRHGRVLLRPARAGDSTAAVRGVALECRASAHSSCLVRRDRGGAPGV